MQKKLRLSKFNQTKNKKTVLTWTIFSRLFHIGIISLQLFIKRESLLIGQLI